MAFSWLVSLRTCDRRKRTAARGVGKALGSLYNKIGERSTGVILASRKQLACNLWVLFGQVRRANRRPRRIVQKGAFAVDFAVEPPLIVDNRHRCTPADGHMIANRCAAMKRRTVERFAVDRFRTLQSGGLEYRR